jgi:hypothetical protein
MLPGYGSNVHIRQMYNFSSMVMVITCCHCTDTLPRLPLAMLQRTSYPVGINVGCSKGVRGVRSSIRWMMLKRLQMCSGRTWT